MIAKATFLWSSEALTYVGYGPVTRDWTDQKNDVEVNDNSNYSLEEHMRLLLQSYMNVDMYALTKGIIAQRYIVFLGELCSIVQG